MTADRQHTAAELERVLAGLLARHEDLLVLTRAHRDALAQADTAAMERVRRRQEEVLGAIADLERCRAGLAGALAARPGDGTDAARAPIAAIAATLPASVGARLTAVAERLREVLVTLSREQRAVQTAAAAIAGHLEGLMTQVARRLSHDGTYRPAHHANPTVPVTSSLDLTT